jgi:hypothetical protein
LDAFRIGRLEFAFSSGLFKNNFDVTPLAQAEVFEREFARQYLTGSWVPDPQDAAGGFLTTQSTS